MGKGANDMIYQILNDFAAQDALAMLILMFAVAGFVKSRLWQSIHNTFRKITRKKVIEEEEELTDHEIKWNEERKQKFRDYERKFRDLNNLITSVRISEMNDLQKRIAIHQLQFIMEHVKEQMEYFETH